jgi:hypothetical protein
METLHAQKRVRYFVAEEKGYPPNQILYPLDQRKTGDNVLETFIACQSQQFTKSSMKFVIF